jgi:predicted SnoaL-like aldol condensation-catalyzing enzyme
MPRLHPLSLLSIATIVFAGMLPANTIAQTTTQMAPPQPPALPSSVFTPPASHATLERNKATVVAFYDLMFNQSKPAEAMRLYGGTSYTQHNPEVPDGKEAFVRFFEQMAKDHPGKSVIFKRVFAEGDYVTLHSEHRFPGWRGGSWAAMDLFALDAAGRIVEHWDVLQKVPSKAAHSNGMF